MIEISEVEWIDVTRELYPATEAGQDAASGAVVAVDSAGGRAKCAERAECDCRAGELIVGYWSLVIGDLGNTATKVPQPIINSQSSIANDQ